MIDRGARYYPALKAALPFAAGIATAGILGLGTAPPLLLLAVALVLLPLTCRFAPPFRLLLVPTLLFLSGALSYAVRSAGVDRSIEGERLADADLTGRVASRPVIRGGRTELTVEVDSIVYRRVVTHPRWSVLLRIEGDSAARLRPAPGDRIAARGALLIPGPPRNPGEPDPRSILRARGVDARFTVSRPADVTVIRRETPGPLAGLVEAMREGARSFAARHVRGEEGDIVRALLLGERDGIDEETTELFRRTGTIHVLSVSGLHVAVIALGLFVLVSWIPDRRLQLALFAGAILLYTVVAGGAPSIVRAAVMAIAVMAARTAGRISRPLNTLGLAALVILAIDPRSLFDIGFQLSFASVAGIMLLHAPLVDLISRRLPRRLRTGAVAAYLAPIGAVGRLLVLSICAQVFTAPLAAHHFGFLSLAGSVANVPVVPLTSIALGASAAGALVDPISTSVASWFGGAAYLALDLAGAIVAWCATLPAAGLVLRPPSAPAAALLCVLALWVALARGDHQMVMRGLAAVCGAVSILLADSILDPLARFDGRSVALLASRGGTVPVTRASDGSLHALAGTWSQAERASAAYAVEAFRRRVGAPSATLDTTLDASDYVPLAVARSGTESSREAIAAPALEAVHRRLPLLLASGARRRFGVVSASGTRLLEVPLRGRMDEGIVLHFNGDWEVVRWR